MGLIPGIGELTTPVFTVLLLFTGLRMRVPLVVLARMVLNTGVDALIGLIPVLGDITDVGWKANLRNLELLERHAVPGMPTDPRQHVGFVAIGIGLIVLVALLAIVPIVLAAWALAWVIVATRPGVVSRRCSRARRRREDLRERAQRELLLREAGVLDVASSMAPQLRARRK